MSTPPPDDRGPPAPFSFEELANLHAGLLTGDDEGDLRMRMEQHPAAARQMLAGLAAVDAVFPDPPDVNAPLEVPAPVAASWQLAIAREAARRARGEASGHTDPERDSRTGHEPGTVERPTDQD